MPTVFHPADGIEAFNRAFWSSVSTLRSVKEVGHMSGIVAVRVSGIPSKQDALLFDRIITARRDLEGYKQIISGNSNAGEQLSALEDFLEDQAILERIPFRDIWLQADKELQEKTTSDMGASIVLMFLKRILEGVFDKFRVSELPARLESFISTSPLHHLEVVDTITRLFSAVLSPKYANITSLLYLTPKAENKKNMDTSERRRAFYDLILPRFPVPSEQTPWEQVIEFRKDRDVQARYLAFRRWIDKAVRSDLPINEIGDELDHLVNEYEQHMRISRMEFKWGSLRTLVSIPLDLVVGGLTLNSRKVARIFELKERRIALLNAELKAPGREISYLVQARDKFSNEQKR